MKSETEQPAAILCTLLPAGFTAYCLFLAGRIFYWAMTGQREVYLGYGHTWAGQNSLWLAVLAIPIVVAGVATATTELWRWFGIIHVALACVAAAMLAAFRGA